MPAWRDHQHVLLRRVSGALNNAGCSAANADVLLLTEAVHAEVEDHGITVTVVCPGLIPS